jgi:hypothetical protein
MYFAAEAPSFSIETIVFWLGMAALFTILFLLPARIITKRHGYTSWLLAFAAVPYLGPFLFLWSLAISSPRPQLEAAT